jgi:hypothetical protein
MRRADKRLRPVDYGENLAGYAAGDLSEPCVDQQNQLRSDRARRTSSAARGAALGGDEEERRPKCHNAQYQFLSFYANPWSREAEAGTKRAAPHNSPPHPCKERPCPRPGPRTAVQYECCSPGIEPAKIRLSQVHAKLTIPPRVSFIDDSTAAAPNCQNWGLPVPIHTRRGRVRKRTEGCVGTAYAPVLQSAHSEKDT